MITRSLRLLNAANTRHFKNFGHKPEPIPFITFLWHGFLTFSFIGMGIEWRKIASFLLGDDQVSEKAPWDLTLTQEKNTESEATQS